MRESETEHLTYAPSYARALRAIGTTARNRVPTSTGTAALYTRKKGAKKGAKAAERRQPLRAERRGNTYQVSSSESSQKKDAIRTASPSLRPTYTLSKNRRPYCTLPERLGPGETRRPRRGTRSWREWAAQTSLLFGAGPDSWGRLSPPPPPAPR